VRAGVIRVVTVLAFAGAVGSGSFADAHHSFASMYAADRTATLEGVVVQFLYRDPHSFIRLSVRDPKGHVVRYEAEWRGAAQLTRQGVTRLTLKFGDVVVVTGSPSRNPEDHWLRVISLLRPKDGFMWQQQ